MIEQYLCTNLDSTGIGENGLPLKAGFGCVARTQNLSDDEASRLDVFAELFPAKRVGADGCILTKFTVGRSGSFAIGMHRPCLGGHISHQFLFTADTRAALVSSPEEFFKLPFIDSYDKNKNYSLKSSPSLELTSAFSNIIGLKETLSAFQLDERLFCRIIAAAFDCRKNNRKIIFVSDRTFEKDSALVASLLYHIFKFLPYHIRMSLGFDTAFSQITTHSQINISFALPTDVSVSDSGVCTVGKRECKNDYIVFKGNIIHSAADNDGSEITAGAYLIPGIFQYISDEFSGIDCTEKLSVLFEHLYEYTSDIPGGYLNDIQTYDAVFAAMDIMAKGNISRAAAEPMLRFYISARKRIKRGEAFWDDALSCFVRSSSDLPTDGWLLGNLASLYCQENSVSREAAVQLKLRAEQLFANDRSRAITAFTGLISGSDPDGVYGLATLLFGASDEISMFYIDHKLGTGKSAFDVCNNAAELCHVLGDGYYKIITEKALHTLKGIASTGADVDSIRRLSMTESSMDIRTVINTISEEAMDNADYSELLPSWFRQQNWSFDFLPERFGAVTVFMVRDMISESVTTLPGNFFANYAYVDKDVFARSLDAASMLVTKMLMARTLPLSVTTYAALHAAVYRGGEYDYNTLCDVLSAYPSEIPAFTAYFGSITNADGIDERAKISRFSKFLKNLEPAIADDLPSVNVCELIASVNRTLKLGIKSKYAKTFNSRLYAGFLNTKRGAVKAYYAVTKPMHLMSSRSIKNSELITAFSVISAIAVIGLIISIIIFGGGTSAPNAVAEIYFSDSVLAATKFTSADIDDQTLITTSANTIYCSELSGTFTVKISENVQRVTCKQQYMYSPDSTVLTSSSTADLAKDSDGNYTFALDTSGEYIYRVIITVTLTNTDGSQTMYVTAIENNNYRGSDE